MEDVDFALNRSSSNLVPQITLTADDGEKTNTLRNKSSGKSTPFETISQSSDIKVKNILISIECKNAIITMIHRVSHHETLSKTKRAAS